MGNEERIIMSYREIKFRGKIRNTWEWIHGAFIPADYTYWREPSIADNNHRFEIRQETLGQYTGFKDKYGTKIYEGDILETLGDVLPVPYKKRMVVLWGPYCSKCYSDGESDLGFFMRHIPFHDFGDIWRRDFMYWVTFGVRVIGNIHDNPELLEEKND